MLNIWSQKSGTSLGTLSERSVATIPLPIISGADLSGVTFTVISGRLPGGLRINYNGVWSIKGSPLEVARTTESTFVIRASNGTEISDRTFSITVEGPDAPVWITEEGTLPVGVVTVRAAQIASISRSYNKVTIVTTNGHNFNYGNIVTIASDVTEINATNVEILQPAVLPGETEEQYNYRLETTITYYKPGSNIPSTSATGTVTLNTQPLTFVLDNSVIDFQLQAIDTDLTAGDELEYFIANDDGVLPPGLTLDRDGRIHGIVDPILSLDLTAREGYYDSNPFDEYPYDFGTQPNISDPLWASVETPRKLNRNYEFYVTVTDGETTSRRRFLIFVVGDDFLRADNMLQPVGTNAFTADSTYLRAPVWLSASNLGIKRANNYITIQLETFDPNPAIGPVKYSIAATNPDLTSSALPDGLFIDPDNAEIFGFVPYQPAITKTYNFTVNATKYDKENLTDVEVTLTTAESAVIGQNFLTILPLPTEDQTLIIGDTIRIGPSAYTITEYISETVLGGTKAQIRLAENLITNIVNGFIIRKIYTQTTAEFSRQTSSKTFTLAVLGEVDSVIYFTSSEDLGALKPSYPSRISVEAITSVPNAVLKYTLVDGDLPPGLELSVSGDIIGKINQFRENSISGFTLFDGGSLTFDGATTTIDKSYRFMIKAEDQFRYSSVTKEFFITVGTNDLTLYSNIYTKPFPKQEKRDLFSNFINDSTIFPPEKIYRLGDPDYGLQAELKMLVYPGIESTNLSSYITAMSTNIRRKRYRLGNVKKAIAKNQGTNDIVYEVIYLEVFDDYESAKGLVKQKIRLSRNINNPVRIDQSRMNTVDGKLGTVSGGVTSFDSRPAELGLTRAEFDRFSPTSAPMTIDTVNAKVSGGDLEYVYPSSISQVRKNLSAIGLTENDFLPLWMTTPQDNRTAATGFIKAIPICYCKPGESQTILENIQNRNFDFTQLDFEIDRFIIDSDINDVQEKYLKFNEQRYNI